MVDKKTPLIDLAGPDRSAATASLRSIKMAQPICEEHQTFRTPRWWEACLKAGHNPYMSEHEKEIKTPLYETDEDGDKVRVGEKVKVKIVSEWNINQVPLDEGVSSGNAVDQAVKHKGYVNLETLGIKPMCQRHNCWRSVKVQGPYGDYCSLNHARLVAAHQDGEAIEILDRKKRNRQLASVDVVNYG